METDDITFRPVDAAFDPRPEVMPASIEESTDDVWRGLRPWMDHLIDALCEVAGVKADDISVSEIRRRAAGVERTPGIRFHRRAARLCADSFAEVPSDRVRQLQAVATGLTWLKACGFEFGSSPAEQWRINRLLNVGSRALDGLLEDRRWRRCAMATLFYRLLRRGLRRAELEDDGVHGEWVVSIGLNGEGRRPWRSPLPTRSSTQSWDEAVIDWVLDQLVSRGLMSLTLGSMIDDTDDGREYAVDEAVASWMNTLSADENRIVAGSVFAPAQLGGWQRQADQRLFDAAAVACEMGEEFAIDEAREDAYFDLVGHVDELRRIPESLSPTFELDDGTTTWHGRWQVKVHPVRRDSRDTRAFCTVETAMVFDGEAPEINAWSARRKTALEDSIHEAAESTDEATFSVFGDVLHQMVREIDRHPAKIGGGDPDSSSRAYSPLWRRKEQGYHTLVSALQSGQIQELSDALRQWTFPCRPA